MIVCIVGVNIADWLPIATCTEAGTATFGLFDVSETAAAEPAAALSSVTAHCTEVPAYTVVGEHVRLANCAGLLRTRDVFSDEDPTLAVTVAD